MAFDYTNLALRKQIIDESENSENTDRKKVSLGQYEIYRDRLRSQVKAYLCGMYSEKTVSEMPVISSVNLARRIVNEEAEIYNNPPKRTFEGVSEQQAKALEQIYKDICVDTIFQKANRYYKLQDQIHIQILPVDGQLKARILLAHQLDVVPSPNDPENADAYVVNGFDKATYAPRLSGSEDLQNQLIADADDYQQSLKRMAVWSDTQNFIMDKNGKIVSGDDVANPIGIKPFVDIASDKDGEYWVRTGAAVTDFTIQFNGALSDLGHIVRMQGFGQAWLKGPQNLIPENLQIGPNFVIKLPIDPNNPVQTDFGFSNPHPDIAGSIQYVETVLSSFLTSRGLDPKIVNGQGQADKFTSGIDRLLASIDAFKPSKDDFDIFKRAEQKFFDVLKVYVNTYGNTDVLPEYKLGQIPDDAKVSILYSGPELVLTESEKIDLGQKKVESGFYTQVEATMEVRGVSREEAEKINKENQAMFQMPVEKDGQ